MPVVDSHLTKGTVYRVERLEPAIQLKWSIHFLNIIHSSQALGILSPPNYTLVFNGTAGTYF